MTAFTDLGDRLVGSWRAEATHPLLPGELIRGAADFAWLDGPHFLVQRTHFDHPDIPDGVCLLEAERQHYFDSRGVQRDFTLTVTDRGWTIEMPQPPDGSFAQRISYVVGPEGITGLCQLAHDGVTWEDDLEISLRR